MFEGTTDPRRHHRHHRHHHRPQRRPPPLDGLNSWFRSQSSRAKRSGVDDNRSAFRGRLRQGAPATPSINEPELRADAGSAVVLVFFIKPRHQHQDQLQVT